MVSVILEYLTYFVKEKFRTLGIAYMGMELCVHTR